MRSHLDRRGLVWGGVGVAILLAITLLGSDGLVWFDAALVGYLFGLIFATCAIIYRYSVWLRRPPTAMLNQRGRDAFRPGRMHNVAALVGAGARIETKETYQCQQSPPACSAL